MFYVVVRLPGPPKWPKEWTLYCLYSLFWDIGPLFRALLEVQVGGRLILGVNWAPPLP